MTGGAAVDPFSGAALPSLPGRGARSQGVAVVGLGFSSCEVGVVARSSPLLSVRDVSAAR